MFHISYIKLRIFSLQQIEAYGDDIQRTFYIVQSPVHATNHWCLVNMHTKLRVINSIMRKSQWHFTSRTLIYIFTSRYTIGKNVEHNDGSLPT